VSGAGEQTLNANLLKRIFTVSPLEIKTYLNNEDPGDPTIANSELSIGSSVISQPTQDALDSKAAKTYVDDKIRYLIKNAPAALDRRNSHKH